MSDVHTGARPKSPPALIFIAVFLVLAAVLTVVALAAKEQDDYNRRVDQADQCVADTMAQIGSDRPYREPWSCR